MDGAWLARWRWRRRGAWLWPTFVLATFVDGVLLHRYPAAGSSQTLAGGILAGLILNVIAVILLSRPGGALLRRVRPDFPVGVARNYAGAAAVGLVTAAMLTLGLLHHPTIVADQRAMNDAIARAQAFIGDRAPATFRANLSSTNTYAIQPGSVYRTCVFSQDGRRTYCVVVKTALPLAQSVTFDGYEPNSLFSQGTN
jgi:hypothetical protein